MYRLLICTLILFASISSIKAFSSIDNCENYTSNKEAVVCSVTDFEVTFMNCDLEYIVLNFDFTGVDFGLNGYTITCAALNFSQQFTSTSSQYIILEADCAEMATFVISDNDNPTCSASFTYGLLCCPCMFTIETEINLGECDNGELFPYLIIDSYGSCIFFDPVITINGNVYVASNPSPNMYFIDEVIIPEPILEFEICYTLPNNEIYCYQESFLNPCASLTNFNVDFDLTNCEDNYMGLPFTFESEGLGQSGFTVESSTGASQSYNLGDEYIFYLPADCGQPVTLTIYDNGVPAFTQSVTVQPICCPCLLEYSINLSPCTNQSTDISLDIMNIEGSCYYYDNWLFKVNGDTLPFDFIGGLYIYNGYQSADSLIIINLCSQVPGFPECYRDTMPNPCFVPISTNQCSISDFSVTVDTNSCAGGNISMNFSVNGTDFGTNGYYITVDTGFSQFYTLTDTTLLTLNADCNENIIVTITDANDSLCTAVDTIGTLCCDCLANVTPTVGTCVSDSFSLSFVLSNVTGSCANYDWSLTLNGQNTPLYATNTGYTSNGIQSADSLIVYEFCSLLTSLPFCISDTIVNPCYQSNNNQCTVFNFVVTPDTSSCSGAMMNLVFGYSSNNFGASGYTISTNTGINQSYSLTDTTLLTLNADCNENIIVTITDANDSLCTAIDTVDALCCPCDANITIAQSVCDNTTFDANISIQNLIGSCTNYNWNLSINGQNYALDTTNTGFLVSGISNSDSLLVYHLCNLVPGISGCFDFTFVNPCFNVATDDTKIDDYLQVSIVGGTFISIKNKYTTDLPISMYSIDGQSITSEIILSPLSSTDIDISRWPNGVYILKSQILCNQVAKKLVNVR